MSHNINQSRWARFVSTAPWYVLIGVYLLYYAAVTLIFFALSYLWLTIGSQL